MKRQLFFLISFYFYYAIRYNTRAHKKATIALQQNWL